MAFPERFEALIYFSFATKPGMLRACWAFFMPVSLKRGASAFIRLKNYLSTVKTLRLDAICAPTHVGFLIQSCTHQDPAILGI